MCRKPTELHTRPEESSPEVEPKLDTNESMFSIPLTEDRSRPSTSNVDSRVISQQQSQMALKGRRTFVEKIGISFSPTFAR